ncbi:MAG: peptide chain release factor N(5)-glutamine methyltransferase, partial [Egibacteraceae bacterium]
MTVAEALAGLRRRLGDAGVPTPDVDAELLVRHVLGWSRGQLLTCATQLLDEDAAAGLARLAQRRAAREPLQLLVGSVGFRHLELAVRPGVFIPRPETEVLAGWAVAHTPPGGVVVEPCTGSGAVACAVASEVPGCTVVATDNSSEAVALARDNAARAGVTVDVRQGDLLDPVPGTLRGRVDVLVSNPPYLATAELAGLEPEVVDWDPRQALVSGPGGAEVTSRLVTAAPAWLAGGGWLLLEVDPSRAAITAAAMAAQQLVDVCVLHD